MSVAQLNITGFHRNLKLKNKHKKDYTKADSNEYFN